MLLLQVKNNHSGPVKVKVVYDDHKEGKELVDEAEVPAGWVVSSRVWREHVHMTCVTAVGLPTGQCNTTTTSG
jgi:hypothetical protein